MAIIIGYDECGKDFLPYAHDTENPRYRFSVGIRAPNIRERLSSLGTNLLRYVFTFDEDVRLLGVYECRIFDDVKKKIILRKKIDEIIKEGGTADSDGSYEQRIDNFEIEYCGKKVSIVAHRVREYMLEVNDIGARLQRIFDVTIDVNFDDLSVDVHRPESDLTLALREDN
ncbi:MAG TPA: hypothetical protein VJJ21_01940 [Candidatus Nanoarchaeia archaeon]|nr:hypothetical protein [Candidatus Nanoarchaeia archaeon]